MLQAEKLSAKLTTVQGTKDGRFWQGLGLDEGGIGETGEKTGRSRRPKRFGRSETAEFRVSAAPQLMPCSLILEPKLALPRFAQLHIGTSLLLL